MTQQVPIATDPPEVDEEEQEKIWQARFKKQLDVVQTIHRELPSEIRNINTQLQLGSWPEPVAVLSPEEAQALSAEDFTKRTKQLEDISLWSFEQIKTLSRVLMQTTMSYLQDSVSSQQENNEFMRWFYQDIHTRVDYVDSRIDDLDEGDRLSPEHAKTLRKVCEFTLSACANILDVPENAARVPPEHRAIYEEARTAANEGLDIINDADSSDDDDEEQEDGSGTGTGAEAGSAS